MLHSAVPSATPIWLQATETILSRTAEPAGVVDVLPPARACSVSGPATPSTCRRPPSSVIRTGCESRFYLVMLWHWAPRFVPAIHSSAQDVPSLKVRLPAFHSTAPTNSQVGWFLPLTVL